MIMKYHSKDINKAMSLCFKNKVKVYPVQYLKTTKHLIEVDWNGNKTPYNKILESSKELNEAMKKTYLFLAEKL